MFSVSKKLMLTTAALIAGSALYAAPAAAQATRTWVSGVGDDANPCSRTAPCHTFAGAISKTAAGGEINCIDPGGFGAVTITKSMSIICDDVEAGILVVGSPAITVNAATTDFVTISGLDLLGVSPANPGTNGINFVNGGGLTVRNTTIKGFANQGINFVPASGTASALSLQNVVVQESGTNGNASTGAVKVSIGTGVTANVTIDHTRIALNYNVGLRVDGTGVGGGTINLSLRNSEIANSGIAVLLKSPAGSSPINAVLEDSVLTQGGTGVIANGGAVFGAASNVTISNQTTGISAINSATFKSFGDNKLIWNGSDGAFTLPAATKQ